MSSQKYEFKFYTVYKYIIGQNVNGSKGCKMSIQTAIKRVKKSLISEQNDIWLTWGDDVSYYTQVSHK